MTTAHLVDAPTCPPPVFAPDLCEHLILARSHRPVGPEDECRACDWHWPCPVFFQARFALISAGVPPTEWA